MEQTPNHCNGVFSSSSYTQSPVRLMQPGRRKEERGLRKQEGGRWKSEEGWKEEEDKRGEGKRKEDGGSIFRAIPPLLTVR